MRGVSEFGGACERAGDSSLHRASLRVSWGQSSACYIVLPHL